MWSKRYWGIIIIILSGPLPFGYQYGLDPAQFTNYNIPYNSIVPTDGFIGEIVRVDFFFFLSTLYMPSVTFNEITHLLPIICFSP